MFALDRYPPNPLAPGQAFSGASHAVITRRDGAKQEVIYFAYTSGSFQMYKTNARSMWVDRDFLTIIPKAKEVLTMPVGWDVYAYRSDGTPAGTGRDTIRGFSGAALLPFTGPPDDRVRGRTGCDAISNGGAGHRVVVAGAIADG